MIDIIPPQERNARLQGAGLPDSAVLAFLKDLESLTILPGGGASLGQDSKWVGQVCRQGRELLASLPARSRRNAQEKTAGHALVHLLADTVWRFFRVYRKPIYDTLTRERSRAVRLEELAGRAADLLPDIMPSRAELASESQSMQRGKDG